MQANLMKTLLFLTSCISLFASCDDSDSDAVGKAINTAPKVSIDRFSATAGKLMVRTPSNGLPEANAPVNFDVAPFITTGLDKNGTSVSYYNFDVQSTTPAPIYVLFKENSSEPVAGQNNIIESIPGDAGYNDFWLVNKVTVPTDYVANSVTSLSEIITNGYGIAATSTIVNCPVVPFGSTASRSKTSGKASELTLGWYKSQAVAYFNFDEAPLTAISGTVPLSPIYVMFNDNAAGPSSGFKTESNGIQTHNVIETSPGDAAYSPLWNVFVIDNTNFDNVTNLMQAKASSPMAAGATVNCPVVK